MIKIAKSVYDEPDKGDGERVLVMRLWPRGISRERARIDSWMKELGTEKDLIKKWKGGKITSWNVFAGEYRKSLKGKEDLLKELAQKSSGGNSVTLLCTDRDPERCHRSLLAEEIEKIRANEKTRKKRSRNTEKKA